MVGVLGEDWQSDDTISAARANQKCVIVKATAPSTLYDGMHWVDSSTDPPTVKWYDLTSTTWYCDVQARAMVLSAGLTVGSGIVSDTQDTDSLGSTTKEWLNVYVGDAGKIYLGLAQDISLNRSAANALTITASSGVILTGGLTAGGSVILPDVSDYIIRVPSWGNNWGMYYTKGADVTLSYLYLVSNSILALKLDYLGNAAFLAGLTVGSAILSDTADTDSLGSAAIEWANLYIGTGKAYFYLDQAEYIYSNAADLILGSQGDDRLGLGSTVFYPTTAGLDLGTDTLYFGDVNYKTLDDRGCLFWADEIETWDGRMVGDLEALKSIRKSESRMSVHGLPALDYTTLPKVMQSPINEKGEGGCYTDALISVMLGAIKELDSRLSALEARLFF